MTTSTPVANSRCQPAALPAVPVAARGDGLHLEPHAMRRIGAPTSATGPVGARTSRTITWRAVPESRPRALGVGRSALLPTLLHDRLMIAVATVFVAYFTLFFQAFTSLPLVMAADGLLPSTYAAMLAGNGVAILAVQPIGVRLLAGRDRYIVLSVSMLIVCLGLGTAAVAHSTAGYTGSVLVWTVGEIGIAVMFGAVFADLAPPDRRGGYLGLAATTWAVGSLLGPLVGTTVLDRIGPTALWLGCAVTGMALCAALQALAPALRARTSARHEPGPFIQAHSRREASQR